jgi:YHS domain-containing protein
MKKLILLFIVIASLSGCSNSNSQNLGQTSSPVLLSDSSKQASCVYLTSDEKNQPVISWCETDRKTSRKNYYMAFFDESSGRFLPRIPVPIEQNASFHEEGMPKVAIKADGTIIAVYETSAPSDSNRFAGFVHYLVSTDKGKTWTAPACVHADTGGGKSHSFAAIARLSDGEIGACWLDESFDRKIGGRPVMFAKTGTNNRFGNELIVDSAACQCCRIAISSNAGGNITVAFRDIINDSIRDMSVSTSNDNGKTFTRAVSFSKDGWVINGCPHNGPAVAATNDRIYATWFTGGRQKGVYYCEMNSNREMLTRQLVSDHGRFIQLCLLPDGARVLAYNENIQEGEKVYSRIILNRIENDGIFSARVGPERSMASYPVLLAHGRGKIIVAWSDNGKISYALVGEKAINTPVQRPSVHNASVVQKNFSDIKLAVSKDLACGMPLSMSPEDTAVFKGKVYGFCSEVCKEKFLQHPEAFINK